MLLHKYNCISNCKFNLYSVLLCNFKVAHHFAPVPQKTDHDCENLAFKYTNEKFHLT